MTDKTMDHADRSPEQPEPPSRDTGAALVEYALLLMLIALACLAAVTLFGRDVDESVSTSASAVETAG